MKYEIIEGDIARISLDNGKANPLSEELSDALVAALDRAEQDAKAVLICGNPGMFSAGFDLKVLAQGMDAAQGMLSKGMLFTERLYRHPQPVVIACEGHAVGMGVFMLLAADYRVGAAGEFAIRLPETAIGMPFTTILKIIAKTHIDARHHSQAIIQSRAYDPRTAAKIGMLDEVVDADKVMETAIQKTQELCQLPSDQYRENKLEIRADEISAIRASLDL